MDYVLKNIPAYERANEQLNQVSKKWQAEVEALNTEAATMYKNYQNEMVFLSQEQKKNKQEQIMQKEKEAADLKQKYFGPEGELFKKRESLMTPIQEEIYNAVKDISASTSASGMFGVISVAMGSSSFFRVATASSLMRRAPLVATISAIFWNKELFIHFCYY